MLGPVPYTVSAPVQSDKTGASLVALRSNMAEFLGTKGITAEELERTINNRVRGLAGNFEGSGDVLGGLQSIDTYGWSDDYYETLGDRYRRMTAAELGRRGAPGDRSEQDPVGGGRRRERRAAAAGAGRACRSRRLKVAAAN
jgi:hypothetical protein